MDLELDLHRPEADGDCTQLALRPSTPPTVEDRALTTTGGNRRGLGSMLVETGLVSEEELLVAVQHSKQHGESVIDLLVRTGRITEGGLADSFCRWLSLERVAVGSVETCAETVGALDEDLARRHRCLPVAKDRRSLSIAMSNPLDFAAIQEIEFATGLMVRPVVATQSEIQEGLERLYGTDSHMKRILSDLKDPTGAATTIIEGLDLDEGARPDSAPVIDLCNSLLQQALEDGASDLHVEPEQDGLKVRMRVDGVLREVLKLPKWLQHPTIARFKVLAKLDIAERRRPQDGRIRAQFQSAPVDIRLSTLHTNYGEKVVMRFLGSARIPTFDALGMSIDQVGMLESALFQPQGMILVTGPTGSGKTTALYSMIARRRSPGENIVTVEDPVEYQLPGINQVQVNAKAGLTFAACLRSILRQDPDVVLVGEIRDAETAEIAFRAAMTGHLVLSTLHTNSAAATITRLLDLGVDPSHISSSVQLVSAQRLARRVCEGCKEEYTPDAALLKRFSLDRSGVYYRGAGCDRCEGEGYVGRVGIFEYMPLTAPIKHLVHERARENRIVEAAVKGGVRFLSDDAVAKIQQGVTNPEAVAKVIQTEAAAVLTCPHCKEEIEPHFAGCPYCMNPIRDECSSCQQPMKPQWKMCPMCMTPRAGEQGPAQLPAHGADS